MSGSSLLRRVAPLALLAALGGCAIPRSPLLPRRPAPETVEEQIRALSGRDQRLTLRDGRVEVLRAAVIEGDSVIGHWRDSPAGPVRTAVAIADVARVRRARVPIREVIAREADLETLEAAVAAFLLSALIVLIWFVTAPPFR